jgi:hypothetical protein
VNVRLHHVAERSKNHPMTINWLRVREECGYDSYTEMTLSILCAHMTGVQMTLIGDF